MCVGYLSKILVGFYLARVLAPPRWALPFILAAPAAAQAPRPVVRAGVLPAGGIVLDGRLDEAGWAAATAIEGLPTVEPVEGGTAAGLTTIRILAGPTELVIGIICRDPDAAHITSVSKARDSELRREDYIRLMFDTFLDGRTGYVFAVNPSGARYDALVSNRGESEDARWDAVWEAKTARAQAGWSVEIRIPLQSLAYQPGPMSGASTSSGGSSAFRR
jgi:hypothetical protein